MPLKSALKCKPLSLGQSAACFKAGQGDRLLANLYLFAREQLFPCGRASHNGGDYCTYQDATRFTPTAAMAKQGAWPA